MKADARFSTFNDTFWSNVKIITQKLGYSVKNKGLAKSYTVSEVVDVAMKIGVFMPEHMALRISEYSTYRANILNGHVFDSLMDQPEAKALFSEYFREWKSEGYQCKLPRNKQSGDKKDYNYFTGIISIIAERQIREFVKTNNLELNHFFDFDSDPKSLAFTTDDSNMIRSCLTRHFDGSYPSSINPLMLWEIKEYYYTKSFGSRVADGIYETQLDGYDIKTKADNTGYKIEHLFMVDGKDAWWKQGRSYLFRIIDMLNQGFVDEVFFGKEVVDTWADRMNDCLRRQYIRLYGINGESSCAPSMGPITRQRLSSRTSNEQMSIEI